MASTLVRKQYLNIDENNVCMLEKKKKFFNARFLGEENQVRVLPQVPVENQFPELPPFFVFQLINHVIGVKSTVELEMQERLTIL